ncbi:MAG: class I SAM-dependent methyltransferase [Dysgonamonadaceae bacterium]|jgi:SAM-dependent methyltransferase|nr:class I SAM-dependent methyltransferase [Dysgonamonadaceae bacterium]
MNVETISRKNRERKYKLFLKEINPSEKDKILDVGFADREYSEVDNFLEKHYPLQSNITALGVFETAEVFRERYPEVSVVLYDGKIFPFANKSFDIGWSNAVIEHVGGRERQLLFVKELCRVCKKVYFTTPNRYFPFEVHTRYPLIHWLPKKIFDKILSMTSSKWVTGDYMNLLSRKSLENILHKAEVESYHNFQK